MDLGYCWISSNVHGVHECAFDLEQNVYVFINNLAMSAFSHAGKVTLNVFLHFPISVRRVFGTNAYINVLSWTSAYLIWVPLYGCGFATHKRSSSYIQFYFGTNFNSFLTPFHAVLSKSAIGRKLLLWGFKLVKTAIS